MKKLVFVVIALLLVGGAWYMQSGSTKDDGFDRAMNIMKNLKSDALSDTQITDLEGTYQQLVNNIIPQMKASIQNNKNDIGRIITAINKPSVTNQKATIIDNAESQRDGEAPLNASIDALIGSIVTPEQLAQIKKEANKLNRTASYLSVREQFVKQTNSPWYGYLRTGLCKSESSSSYDVYTAGKVLPRFDSSAAHPTFVPKIDSCGTGANANKLTEYRCVEGQFRVDQTENFTRTTTCTYGCKTIPGTSNPLTLAQSFCLKGEINPATITSDAAGSTVLSEIKTGQPFYLKANAMRVSDPTTPLVIDVSSPAFNGTTPNCVLQTKTANFTTVGQTIVFGPITCTTNATFTFSLKEGTSEIDTATTSVAIGANAMKELVVVPPTGTITVGTVTPFTVRAMGTNGFPYNKFTSPVLLILTGDSQARNLDNFTIGTANGGDTEKVFNVTFSKVGNVIVEAIGGAFSSEPITVTVVGVRATATAILSGTTLTATVTNGGSGYVTTPIVTVTAGDGCTVNPTATATVANGSVTGVTLTGGTCTTAPTLSIAPPQ